MSRRLIVGLALGALAVLLAVWFVLDRKVERLDAALGRELGRVENLDSLLGDANTRIDDAYRRMDEADRRRNAAEQRIAEADSAVALAGEERSEAETAAQEAMELGEAARKQAEEARRREEAERRRREEEWSRLARALGKVASARREGGSVAVDLGPGFVQDKEKISRLAGVLLAHHGYRVTVEGEGAAGAESYLLEAGIPQDILTLGAAGGRLRLTVRDELSR
ncbi:MAG: hypothetical protein KDC27_19995 [Acidobacteria bacterium]|nr:hypothetical protein [Acidobacteriota bacterium]